MTPGSEGLGPLADRLVASIESGAFMPLALAIAFGAGVLHACAPGHGKSLTAAYLVGAHGRRRDAVLLGSVVAVMHTLSVLAIGLAWLVFSASPAADIGPLTRALEIVAGVLVVMAGAVLVRRRHHHSRHHHQHHHATGPPPGTRPGLVLLGVSGGLMPSPAAFLALLAGLLTGRTGLALLLVAVFGIGMALVLSLVGLATVAGRDILTRRAELNGVLRRASSVGPALAAWAVLTAGCLLTGLAVTGTAFSSGAP